MEREQYVKDSINEILLVNLGNGMVATVMNSTRLILVLWHLISHSLLLTWYGVNCLFVLFRYLAIAYDKKTKDNYNERLRKNVILDSFIIFFVVIILFAQQVYADEIVIVADQWPPYNSEPESDKPGVDSNIH